MNKIAEFLSKWAFAIVLCLIAVALLFAVGCCIYTSITNPLVGIIALIGTLFALGILANTIAKEGESNL